MDLLKSHNIRMVIFVWFLRLFKEVTFSLEIMYFAMTLLETVSAVGFFNKLFKGLCNCVIPSHGYLCFLQNSSPSNIARL